MAVYGKKIMYKNTQKIQEIVKEKQGICSFDIEQIDSKRPRVLVTCKYNHQWIARCDAIIRGTWCKQCNINQKRHTIEYINLSVGKFGYSLLSTKYQNCDQKLKWKCNKNHEFNASFDQIDRQNFKCPLCYQKIKVGSIECNRLITRNKSNIALERLKNIVIAKKGELINIDNYQNINSKITLKCNKDHIWTTKAACILNNRWCPACNESKRRKSI